jgi:hypothetical protein
MSHATTHQMVCCVATGQVAGLAATVSIKENATYRNIDINIFPEFLKNQGVRID